jgi:uncharacterized protein (DUF1501 family)
LELIKGKVLSKNKYSRRKFIEQLLWSLPTQRIAMGSSLLSFSAMPSIVNAQTTNKKKLIQIFLNGGWDSIMATDPIISGSSKDLSSGYDGAYKNATYYGQQVTGKANLFHSHGLATAAPAFQNFNCAFINGMFVEVTAHELAQMYLLSGKMTLSRSREYASFIAKMGETSGQSTPHVVLGNPIPLGDTALSSPPIFSNNARDLSSMIGGPSSDWVDPNSIARAHQLISQLNANRESLLSDSVKATEGDWKASESALIDLYNSATDYQTLLTLNSTEAANYGVPVNGTDINDYYGSPALINLSKRILQSGLTPYVTVRVGGYDTHENHFGRHDVAMRDMGSALNQLMIDLAATPDPTDPGKNLIDNTTILVFSEFNRTPILNQAAGTDHWKTASAILLGAGVTDNFKVGGTDDNANALGWDGSATAPITESNALMAEHLMATICQYFGYQSLADELSATKITGLLT